MLQGLGVGDGKVLTHVGIAALSLFSGRNQASIFSENSDLVLVKKANEREKKSKPQRARIQDLVLEKQFPHAKALEGSK